ncbi:MraY family glycosyltransferase [Herbiconiux sp. L3-i23]|uniref:MraY family glycosyltransferase n=1 Tax=Herbiconiux sp. L3-i23 TaxID=2905871 RepID=UPI00206B2EB9|nr:MraY family glycosyltransferase [Herbiconiux sp. L3-i23]BDI22004.1 undecaprenyl-phosphate alpha-N-acetylglucosaminyl 1-phosphate transferase [Herbiconiux sp. L3-i23]
MTLYALVALIAAAVTFGLSLIVYRLGRRYNLHPEIRARDVHTRPTPRLGGVAMFGGVLVAFAIASQIPFFDIVFAQPAKIWAIVGAAAIIVVIGVADDLLDLDWMIKLAGQILTAGLLAWQGVAIVSLPIGGLTVGSAWMSLVLTVFAVVFVMNAVNFIDGLDGLVAGVAIIGNGVFFLYSYLIVQQTSPNNYFNLASLISAITIGACLGLLPLNARFGEKRPAKLFMGDGGAYLVGLLMATSGIAVTGQVDPVQFGATFGRSSLIPAFLPILLPLAILIVPFLDFALAVTRRLLAGKSPFSADRKHLHHRLLDMGHSHMHAVLIFYAWTAVVSVGALLIFVLRPWTLALAFIAVGLVVCAVLTLAPLSRRKATEAAAQSAPADDEHRSQAALDPLDAASESAVAAAHPEPVEREPR